MTEFQPKHFGKYQLLDKIAAGGMAELFRAKLTGAQGFEKLIAIKKILSNLVDEDNLVKSFIDEAKLAALLHHENIVQIYDFGNMDGEFFIAMEYLFGKDLRTITQTASEKDLPISTENVLYIAARICAGLDYSHNLKDLQGKQLNIIHRDINPQNILITYEGQVKIIDFGIAKAASHNTKTRENLIKGKLAYMSPEQAQGQTIDHRSDIFSTGIILYEMLAARRMFQGETLHVLSLVREAQYDPPEKVIPNLPNKLSEILGRALAKDPAERYQSCGEMLADIEECAFELALRPNARTSASYMKALFEEEFAEEEIALWTQTKSYGTGELATEQKSGPAEEKNEDTVLLTKVFLIDKLKQFTTHLLSAIQKQLEETYQFEKLKQLRSIIPTLRLNRFNFRHGALLLGLVAVIMLVGLGLNKMSSTGIEPEVSAHSGKSTNIEESVGIAKLAAAKAALQAKRYTLATTLFEEILAGQPSMRNRVVKFYAKAL
ncbi:MAG: serine/threonine protein kinase, partial [Deltaproteobacteria bacterium]|nr:serine/threonine protein kinase [Deltaproteobacteria bacterium]